MRSVDEIYASLCAKFKEKSGVSVIEGGDMSLRLYAVAYEAATLEANADFVARQAFPQTAVGEYLDYHAEMRGLKRREATRAEGVLRFYTNEAASSALAIPEGTVCLSSAEEEFVTTAGGVIAEGETWCEVRAKAKAAGTKGNAAAGSITVMELVPAGVAGVINTQEFSGGADAESDAELSKRVVTSYRKLPNGANKAYYETKALNVDGVCAVQVFPKKRGIGTVDIVISGESGIPSASLVNEVQALLDGEREICVDIAVSAPEAVSVDIAAQLTLSEGADKEQACANAERVLREYFDGRILGKNVYRARLGALLLGVEGVENYVITSPAEDVGVTAAQLAVLGSLNLSGAV